jgi:hypothetical protein
MGHIKLSSMVGSEVANGPVTSTAWVRDGQSIARADAALYGFKDETKAA